MNIQLIDNWSEFERLGGEWNALLAQSDENCLFLTWEWIHTWLKIVKPQIKPYALVAREANGELVGIAPFYRTNFRLLKVIRLRALRVMADQATAAEYPNLIAKSSASASIKSKLFEALLDNRNDWDCIWMPHLQGWSRAHQTLVEALAQTPKLSYNIRDRDFCFVTLADNLAEHKKSQSKNLKSTLRRVENGIAKKTSIELKRCTESDELEKYFDTLLTLHHKRWQLLGEEGAFVRMPVFKAFYQSFIATSLAKGWLRFYLLECAGVARAIQIGFVYNNVFHVIQEGFDTDFNKGVGNILRRRVIEKCIEENVTEYDFLEGYTEHKRRWGAKYRAGKDLFIWNNNKKNFLFSFKTLWPGGRFLKRANN